MRRLMTLDEVAGILRVDLDEVVRLIDAHELDAVDLPRGVTRIQATDLARFLRLRRRTWRPARFTQIA